MSEQSLLTLRSDFETGARCFHDLRCLCSQCPRLQFHLVEPILDKLAAPPLMGWRSETHTFYGNMASDEQETAWIFRFYGDRDGAHRFWEMATGAGGYLDANAMPLLPRRRKRWLMGVEEGAFYWMRAIFTVAWDWKNRPGLALRADKIKFPGPHGVPYYSPLRINPFSASVMLIDVLLGDVTPTIGLDGFQRPVKLTDAAGIINKRSDVIGRALKGAGCAYAVVNHRAYGEHDDLCKLFPRYRKYRADS